LELNSVDEISINVKYIQVEYKAVIWPVAVGLSRLWWNNYVVALR